MRSLVVVLVLLAAAKIGAQQYLVDSAKSDVIVNAYRERAVGACQDAVKRGNLRVGQEWVRASDARVVIGKSSLDVQLWQLDHALWTSKYKSPFLFLTISEQPAKIYCEYDISQGVASVIKL